MSISLTSRLFLWQGGVGQGASCLCFVLLTLGQLSSSAGHCFAHCQREGVQKLICPKPTFGPVRSDICSSCLILTQKVDLLFLGPPFGQLRIGSLSFLIAEMLLLESWCSIHGHGGQPCLTSFCLPFLMANFAWGRHHAVGPLLGPINAGCRSRVCRWCSNPATRHEQSTFLGSFSGMTPAGLDGGEGLQGPEWMRWLGCRTRSFVFGATRTTKAFMLYRNGPVVNGNKD